MGMHVIVVEVYNATRNSYQFQGEVYGPYATADDARQAAHSRQEPEDKSFCVAPLDHIDEFLKRYEPK